MRRRLRRLFGRKGDRGGGGGGGGSQGQPDERDRQAIEAMRAAGEDLSGPRAIEHTLVFANAAGAGVVVERVRQRGFEAETRTAPDGAGTVLVVRQRAAVTLDAVTEARSRLSRMAGNNGGRYEGWTAPPAS